MNNPCSNKAAVFILLGQSNAVGHGVPMMEEDKILIPMKNVFGLSRDLNQSFNIDSLQWNGYTSFGMNLAETQDNTYSVVNQLATLWQKHIDNGNILNLPDLYIIQIAIGAQGVTEEYMWNPSKEEKLIPGPLGTVNISLFKFSCHIFSLLKNSFNNMNKEFEIIGLHWRGGENDITSNVEMFTENLEKIYCQIFDSFNRILDFPPTFLHKIIAKDRMFVLDPTGIYYERMLKINEVFENLIAKYKNFKFFNMEESPLYVPTIRRNGVFIDDAVHFTPEANKWVAEKIINNYSEKKKK